jgi:hypothetical protein
MLVHSRSRKVEKSLMIMPVNETTHMSWLLAPMDKYSKRIYIVSGVLKDSDHV